MSEDRTGVLDRVLGAGRGTRMPAVILVPDDDPLDLKFTLGQFAQSLFLWAGLLAALSAVATSVFADPAPAYRPLLVGGSGLAGIVGAVAIRLIWDRISITPRLTHIFMALSITLISAGTWASGPVFAAYGSMFLIWPAIAAGLFFRFRTALLHLALIAVAQGVLLAIHRSSSPGGRWLLLVGTCVCTAFVIDKLMTRLEATAGAQVALRREAEEATRLLEVASRHKSEFLASMSHELRTPLNAVIGFADVLLTRHFGDLNDDQAEYVGDIRDSGQHLLALINDVLDLSKVESGKLELDPRWFGLPETIRSSINLVAPRAEAAGIEIRLDLAEGTDEAYGDERRVKQVLVNLLTNAVKFTPPGGTVDVLARTHDDDVVVAVRDSGVGIAPDDQARIFEDFHQVGDADLAKEGTGLGLALSRRFLELHGGSIWVESEPGAGATFTFNLPRPERAEVLADRFAAGLG